MNLFGGNLLFGLMNFCLCESSFSSLCGLFCGNCSCSCWELVMAVISEKGLRNLRFWRWVLSGNGVSEGW